MPKPKQEFKANEVKNTLDTLDAMIECAVDREDGDDEQALRTARGAVTMLLGNGGHDAVVTGWPVEPIPTVPSCPHCGMYHPRITETECLTMPLNDPRRD